MAVFCTKCGATLPSTTGFCPACGTPIGNVTAAPPPVAPMQAVPVPVAGYPVAAPPASSSGVLKVVLIVIAVVIGLGVLGAGALGFMAWRVSKAITVDANGKGSTVSLPGVGTISAGDSTATAAELGVPVYPGATQKKGGMNMDSARASVVMASFSTDDSASQVVDFYKSRMGDGAATMTTGNGTVINSGGPDTDRIMVTVGPGTGDSTGKTMIVIMHTTKK